MMKTLAKHIFCIVLLLTIPVWLEAQNKFKTSSKTQISSWSSINFGKDVLSQTGGRIIPSLNLGQSVDSSLKIDAEISLNANGYLTFSDFKKIDQGESFKPYRLWLRFSGKKWEVRAGLQKINFGSASMLRPLMWFDQLDPRDPLQLTNGVYGLLGRYYFKNNANLWLWGLLGNNKLKGWEAIPSVKDIPEFGGRFQFPLLKGEFAASYHQRTINTADIPFSMGPFFNAPEYKLGFDGKWEYKIGFWFESSLSQTARTYLSTPYQSALNIGMDYTFGIGNGINLIYEQLFFNLYDEDYKNQNNVSFSALSVSYPFGLFSRLAAIVYYDWMNKDVYRFVNFQMSFDYWTWYVMAFWNPENLQLVNMNMNNSLFGGKGLQLMAVYNF
jgi:hypothetical protein